MKREELETMHWSHLKKMLEEKGLTYESKEKAIADLSEATGATPPDAPTSAAKAVAFDAKQPHGLISGEIEGAPSARFLQHGNFYTSEGVKVG